MRFILGAPCSGKGTIGRELSKHISTPFLSAGEILRKQTATDPEIAEALSQGKLISLEKTASLLMQEAQKYDYDVFFDGFPRTFEQSNFIYEFSKKNNIAIKGVFYIYCEKSVLIERTRLRTFCDDCQCTFSQEIMCCDKKVTRRSDDKVSVFHKRYKIFNDSIDIVLKNLVGPVYFIENKQNSLDVAVKTIQNLL